MKNCEAVMVNIEELAEIDEIIADRFGDEPFYIENRKTLISLRKQVIKGLIACYKKYYFHIPLRSDNPNVPALYKEP